VQNGNGTQQTYSYVPTNRRLSQLQALQSPVSQVFGYDKLYRLTNATGVVPGCYDPDDGQLFDAKYTLAMNYDNIHNIIPALPFCSVKLTAKKPINSAYPKTLTTLGDHIRKRRLDLGLLQKEVALTLGVTESAITNWELNRVTPYFTYLPRIIVFLGYTPPPYDKVPDNVIERIKLYRQIHGLSQEKFAKLIGVDETTVAKWERGKHQPSKKLIEKFSVLS
jgi:transcriptional regulator with XRE-family HTH domain